MSGPSAPRGRSPSRLCRWARRRSTSRSPICAARSIPMPIRWPIFRLSTWPAPIASMTACCGPWRRAGKGRAICWWWPIAAWRNCPSACWSHSPVTLVPDQPGKPPFGDYQNNSLADPRRLHHLAALGRLAEGAGHPGRGARRPPRPFVGFGDPWFNAAGGERRPGRRGGAQLASAGMVDARRQDEVP